MDNNFKMCSLKEYQSFDSITRNSYKVAIINSYYQSRDSVQLKNPIHFGIKAATSIIPLKLQSIFPYLQLDKVYSILQHSTERKSMSM